MEDEEIQWVIPDFIQTGTVDQIQGAMDIGKSIFTADFFAKVSIGGQRQNRTADPLFFRQVLYRLSYLAISGDDGIRTRDLLRDRQA